MSAKPKWYFVWVTTSTDQCSPQLWSYHPDERASDSKAYGRQIVATFPLSAELNEIADAPNGLQMLAERFPCPVL